MHENEITEIIIDAAVKVHQNLGPGLYEIVYEKVLAYELSKRGLSAQTQVPIKVTYDSIVFDEGFRADIIVNDLVIIELKSVQNIAKIHHKQLLTYLRLSDKKVGLLLNFNEVLMKDGIYRVVNGL